MSNPSPQYTVTLFNAACVDAVFKVDKDRKVKDLKKKYSAEVSNPLSDMLYAIIPDKDERPDPIAGGAFVPESVLTFVADDGRYLEDDEPLFPEDDLDPEFTAQVFIKSFEADMPELFKYMETKKVTYFDEETKSHRDKVVDLTDEEKADELVRVNSILTVTKIPHYYYDTLEPILDSLHNGTGHGKLQLLEKIIFHMSKEVCKLAIVELYEAVTRLYSASLGSAEIPSAHFDFLKTMITQCVNRFDSDDLKNIFDEILRRPVSWSYAPRFCADRMRKYCAETANVLKVIMSGMLDSKRVHASDIVNSVFKKHLCDVHVRKKYNLEIDDAYMSVMRAKGLSDEDLRIAQSEFENSNEEG